MDENITIALIGFGGVVIGAVTQIIGGVVKHYLEQRVKDKTDQKRKQLLMKMLENPRFKWRNLEALMHVIGADEENTKRLLLEIGARGSEDKQELWGLIKLNPFKEP